MTLAACIGVVVIMTKALQYLQRVVLGVLPFGALSAVSLVDVCLGMLVSGTFMMYFGKPQTRASDSVPFFLRMPPPPMSPFRMHGCPRSHRVLVLPLLGVRCCRCLCWAQQ